MWRNLSFSAIFLLLLPHRAIAWQNPPSAEMLYHTRTAHGVLMGVAFGLLFPLGAAIMHAFKFKGFIWFHSGWQLFAYLLTLAGFGIGVWLAVVTDQLKPGAISSWNGHPIIGIVVVGMLFLQPLGGWLAHRLQPQQGRSTTPRYVHRWIGRVFLTLGAINGGLGLQLAKNTIRGEIAYGFISGVCFSIWFGLWLFSKLRTRSPQPLGKEAPRASSQS